MVWLCAPAPTIARQVAAEASALCYVYDSLEDLEGRGRSPRRHAGILTGSSRVYSAAREGPDGSQRDMYTGILDHCDRVRTPASSCSNTH